MKYSSILSILCATALGTTATLLAENSDASKPDKPKPPYGKHHPGGPEGKRGKPKLPPELQERMDAAREKVSADPQIQALREKTKQDHQELMEATKAAMEKADPTLSQDIKSYLESKRSEKSKARGEKGKKDRTSNLSPEEKEKLKAAKEKAEQHPSAKDAAAKKESASTTEEKEEARKNYREVLEMLMKQDDPEITVILEKLSPTN